MDLDRVIADLFQSKYPDVGVLRILISKATELFAPAANVVSVPLPVSICGDTHGQFYDLLELFSIGGRVPYTNYVFLGDYVDRGYGGVETFLLLVALKVRYPQRMTLLRGNHESRQTTQAYGFYDEVMRKYGDQSIWELFNSLFDLLPLCAVIGNRVFCVHGGLSPALMTIEQMQAQDRKREVPERGPICDLLWSDPENIAGFSPSPRGAGYLFGESAVKSFLDQNGLKLMCRAHQLATEGYVEWFNGILFTVWSSPNYCYRGGNPASILEVNENGSTVWKKFEAAPLCARGDVPDRSTIAYFL